DILRAVYFAVDHGAKVINMSFSFAGPSEELMRAMNFASERGVVCVSSTGNLARETLAFPASFQNVIGVASTNNLDARSTFSSFGAALADMAAPGEAIISTFPGKHYAAAWGTSFSTPFVSGAVALLVQAKPTIDPKGVYGSLGGLCLVFLGCLWLLGLAFLAATVQWPSNVRLIPAYVAPLLDHHEQQPEAWE